MDPNACYQLWLEAEDFEEKWKHWDNLVTWIRSGGFELGWSITERSEFLRWDWREGKV